MNIDITFITTLHRFTRGRIFVITFLEGDDLVPDHVEHHPVQGPALLLLLPDKLPFSRGRDNCLQSGSVFPAMIFMRCDWSSEPD